MALIGNLIGILVLCAGVAGGRWLVSRAFGVRGSFREVVNTGAERGRPVLAYARALGAIAGIYLGCVLVFVPGFAGGRTVIDETSMRVTVMDGPAYRAGVETGDRIVSVDGEKIESWDQLKKIVAAHNDQTIEVVIERGTERKTFRIVVVESKIRVGPYAKDEPLGGGEVLAASFAAPFEVARGVLRGFGNMLGSKEKPELSGPAGIAKEVNAAGSQGAGPFFRLVGALASYQGLFIALVLLSTAFFTGFVAKRTLPTSGNSS